MRITFGACRSAARSASAKVFVSRADLALVHGRLDVPVHVLDRIFDGDDVVRVVVVDLVDDRRERRRLARAGRAGDQHDAVLQLADVRKLRRQLQRLQRRDPLGDDAQNDGVRAALREDVHAEARLLRDRVREVDRAVRQQRARQLAVAAQHVHGDHLGLIRRQPRQPGKVDRRELAVDLDLRRPADREVEVGHPVRHLQHRLENGVEIEVLHQRPRVRALYVDCQVQSAQMSIIAIDYGGRRIGVAVSDPASIATPHSVVRNEGDIIGKLAGIARELDADTIVVGVPRRAHSSARRSRSFATSPSGCGRKPAKRSCSGTRRSRPIEAARQLRDSGTKRREAQREIDMHAAAVILQSYLDDVARRTS